MSDPGEVSGLGASPGLRLALLTFYHRQAKRGPAARSILSRLCAEQVGGRLESSMETADGQREPSKDCGSDRPDTVVFSVCFIVCLLTQAPKKQESNTDRS